jgi:hypothetical protein
MCLCTDSSLQWYGSGDNFGCQDTATNLPNDIDCPTHCDANMTEGQCKLWNYDCASPVTCDNINQLMDISTSTCVDNSTILSADNDYIVIDTTGTDARIVVKTIDLATTCTATAGGITELYVWYKEECMVPTTTDANNTNCDVHIGNECVQCKVGYKKNTVSGICELVLETANICYMNGTFSTTACDCASIEYSAEKELYTSQIVDLFSTLATSSFRVMITGAQFENVKTCGCSSAKGYLWDEATSTCLKKTQKCHAECASPSTAVGTEDCICYDCNALHGLVNGGRNNECILVPVETYPYTDVATSILYTEVNGKVYAGK